MLKPFCLSLLLALLTIPVQAEISESRPLITVSGQAEVRVAPDEAVFRLRVETLDKDLTRAKSRNDEIVSRVLDLTRARKIDPADVQTNLVTIEPRYSNLGEKKPTFLGYAMAKGIVVRLRDITQTESMLADVTALGVGEIEAVEFRSSQMRKHADQARAQAMKAAQEKAAAMAREIGQSIGKAFTITEEAAPTFSMQSNTFSRGNQQGADSTGGSTIAAGEITVQARVQVSFLLEG